MRPGIPQTIVAQALDLDLEGSVSCQQDEIGAREGCGQRQHSESCLLLCTTSPPAPSSAARFIFHLFSRVG